MAQKLDNEPALQGESAPLIRWARRVVAVVNALFDAIGSIRTGTSDITSTLDGPAFVVYRSTDQTGLSTTVETIILFDAEQYDTGNAYNPANGRFTPQVAGFYQFSAAVQVNSATASNNAQLAFWKNGVMTARVQILLGSIPPDQTVSGSALIYLNGTTDYVDVRVLWGNSTTPSTRSGINACFFTGHLARRA